MAALGRSGRLILVEGLPYSLVSCVEPCAFARLRILHLDEADARERDFARIAYRQRNDVVAARRRAECDLEAVKSEMRKTIARRRSAR